MTTTEPRTTQVVYLRPEQVEPNPENLRDATRDIPALAKSLKEVGVIHPLIVTEFEDWADGPQYLAIDGSRRVNAARSLGEESPDLPCIVATDLDDARAIVQVMAVTTLARDGFTIKETIGAVQAMLAVGMSQAGIARATGLTGKTVKAAKQAATVLGKVAEYDLNLEQMAALAEFEDDEDATAELLEAAADGPGDFEHALARVRRRVARDKELAKAGKQWVDDGYTVFTDEKDRPIRSLRGDNPIRLDALRAGDTEPPTVLRGEAHTDCPGRAVFLWQNYSGNIGTIECCTHPELHSFLHPEDNIGGTGPAAGSPEQVAAAEAAKAKATEERRLVINNNKAMLAAGDVRKAFLTRTLTNKRNAKKLAEWALGRVVDKDPVFARWIGSWRDSQQVIEEITGGHTLTDAVMLWAQVCSAYESQWPKDCWRQDGHSAKERTVYLDHLVSLGYPLSDVEKIIVATGMAWTAQTIRPHGTYTSGNGYTPAGVTTVNLPDEDVQPDEDDDLSGLDEFAGDDDD